MANMHLWNDSNIPLIFQNVAYSKNIAIFLLYLKYPYQCRFLLQKALNDKTRMLLRPRYSRMGGGAVYGEYFKRPGLC